VRILSYCPFGLYGSIPLFFLLERRQPNFYRSCWSREIFSAGKLHPVGIHDNIYQSGKCKFNRRRNTSMPRQHQSSAMKKVLSELKRLGFEVNRSKSGVWKIVPPSTIEGPIYTTHGTESALHPMRRDFKRMYNVDLRV